MNTPDYIIIPLTRGQETVVDMIDADLLELKWTARQDSRTGKYYAIQCSARPCVQMGRIILSRKLNRELLRDELCDHIDLDTLNNRRSNLRCASVSQNGMNSSVQKNNKSGYTGIRITKWGYRVCIGYQGKILELGTFKELQDAIKARREAEEKYFGEFRRKD